MSIIQEHLNQIQKLCKDNNMSGLRVHVYVGDKGKQYTQHTTPLNTQPIDTQIKACFRNAALASLMYGYDYVEGFYTTDACPELVLEHAWNIDSQGRVIDYTANKFGINVVEYFGVAMTRDDVTKVIKDKLYSKNQMTPLQVVVCKQ
jgi:hypothetical protein